MKQLDYIILQINNNTCFSEFSELQKQFIIIQMDYQTEQAANRGLAECFGQLHGPYCARKLTQFIVSVILLISTIIVIVIFIHKHRIQRQLWLLSALLLMAISLLTNIIFCLYNEQYWLYAIESYLYNLYYLAIVSYICRAYILKYRRKNIEKGNGNKKLVLKQNIQQKNTDKNIFYTIVIGLTILYTAIFIYSLFKEISSQNTEQQQKITKIKFCSQVEYLVFNVICVLISIVVLIILHKNQKEEQIKMIQYQHLIRKRPQGSLLTQQQELITDRSDDQDVFSRKIHNPLTKLWVWILPNVFSQIFDIIQSGLMLEAVPPQCLIIKSKPASSNYLQLAFTFLTLYLGYVATIWYVTQVKIIEQTTMIDRSKLYSQEVKVTGNIELFLPSKQQVISII